MTPQNASEATEAPISIEPRNHLIDTHAHIDAAGGVNALKRPDSDAHVIAVTNLPRNFTQLRRIHHPRITWALGLHPAQPHPPTTIDEFIKELATCTVIGEIGLDATTTINPGGVPMARQRNELERILSHPETARRLITIHSRRSIPATIEHLAAAHHPAAVLHWFTGTPTQARKAADLGAYFSINDRMHRKNDLLTALPHDRVLLETDAPYTGKTSTPGSLEPAVRMLAHAWSLTRTQVEDQILSNQQHLFTQLDVHPLSR